VWAADNWTAFVKPASYITNKSSGRHQVGSKYSRYNWSKFVAKDPDLFRSCASGHATATESDNHELKPTTIRSPTGHINRKLTSAKSLLKLTPAYVTHSWSVKRVCYKLNRWCVYVNCFVVLAEGLDLCVHISARARTHTHTYIYTYRYAPHNDVSVNDGPRIRRWSHNIIIPYVTTAYSIQYSNLLYRFPGGMCQTSGGCSLC